MGDADRRLADLFPADATSPARRRRKHLTAFLGGVAVIALVLGLLLATGAFGSSGSSYTTATAGPAMVDARQTGVATIEPVAQATVAFPVSGTVASVNVALGQAVDAGGTLASLDTTSLTTTLHAKQAALAQAQLTLSKALSGQSISLGSASGGFGGSSGSGGTGGSNATTAAARTTNSPAIVLTAAPVDPQLSADEQAVLAAQQQVDAALGDAATAVASETTVCAAVVTPPTPPPSPSDIAACEQAITAVTTAQHAVTDAQHALATASTTLDTYLQQLASTPPATTPPTTTPTTPSTGRSESSGGTSGGFSSGASSGGSGASRTSGSASSAPSAADLVAAQQAVDAATAAVAAAQQSIDQATVTSPIAGTVVAVNMNVGDHVSASSSTENVVVQGTGGYQVTTTVDVDDIPQVSIGQDATVQPDGTHRTLDGKVVAISVAPAATTTSTTLYRVVVGLTGSTSSLQNGATGTVSIMTKQARAAVAVPTSAVTTARNRHFVTVLHGGSTTLTPVQVGVLGSRWTQITKGLAAGQQVVLADQGAPLPGSATSSSNGTQTTPFGGFGRFGGGAGGGGFGGFGGRGGRGQ
jgi:HlyD family secretion protein